MGIKRLKNRVPTPLVGAAGGALHDELMWNEEMETHLSNLRVTAINGAFLNNCLVVSRASYLMETHLICFHFQKIQRLDFTLRLKPGHNQGNGSAHWSAGIVDATSFFLVMLVAVETLYFYLDSRSSLGNNHGVFVSPQFSRG